VPAVVTDVPATHSLVAMVMGDLDEPGLLVKGSASPHHYSLRPSGAHLLESADLVIWLQAELSPWLVESIQALAPAAQSLELMQAATSHKLPARQQVHFMPQRSREPLPADVDSAKTSKSGDQVREVVDPHGWLDPVNAQIWLGLIADSLQQLDPDNAAEYQSNARVAQEVIEALQEQLQQQLAPLADLRFMVAHDSFQYFEHRFGLSNLAAVTSGDAVKPGPKRMQTLRDVAREHRPVCMFAEPTANPRRLAVLLDGLDVRVGTLDPLGLTLTPGPDLYPSLLKLLATDLSACLQP